LPGSRRNATLELAAPVICYQAFLLGSGKDGVRHKHLWDRGSNPIRKVIDPLIFANNRNMGKSKTRLIILILLVILIIGGGTGCGNVKLNESTKIMLGETFCLSGSDEKRFYRIPQKIYSVYGYDAAGNKIDYFEGKDYEVDYKNGTIHRSYHSSIPDYSNHKVVYNGNGKFEFNTDPRNPELNVMYQIHVNYSYSLTVEETKRTITPSSYLSESTRQKLKRGDDISIALAGDSIAGGAQTTGQYFHDDRIADTFFEYLCKTIERVYDCKVSKKLISEGGIGRDNLAQNTDEILTLKPDVLIIEFGMNDHIDGREAAESFHEDIDSYVKYFKDAGIDVILVGFFKQNPFWIKENASDTELYNNILSTIARENNVYFADIQARFDKVSKVKDIYEDVTVDYMHHPSDWGHQLYFSEVFPVFCVDEDIRTGDIQYYVY